MAEVHVARMSRRNAWTNPCAGRVAWSPVKSLWFSAHAIVALVGIGATYYLGLFSWKQPAVSAVLTGATLCLGHSVGLHRLLVHRSFECPRWVEYVLVHLGTVVGMQGPLKILYMHDIRDWSQRHAECHPFYIHRASLWRDFIGQMHCELRLNDPPVFTIESRVADDRVYRWLQRTWMLQQLPCALLCYALGGWPLVAWGVSGRIVVSLTGHWLVGYCAHNYGTRDWHLAGHAVQGYNLPHLGLLTMGESWHNNHHAFPESARLGLTAGQFDPGWWALCMLRSLGWAWNLNEPRHLPERPELTARLDDDGAIGGLPASSLSCGAVCRE